MAGIMSHPEWHAGCDSLRGRQIVADDGPNGESYCIATAHSGNGRDHSANAELIAAAPDMLAALELALVYMLVAHRTIHGYDPLIPDDMLHSPQIDAARAAIAKARGDNLYRG